MIPLVLHLLLEGTFSNINMISAGKFCLGRHRKHQFKKKPTSKLFVKHELMMQDRVLVSPEECTSNSNGLLNEDVEIASEDLSGGDERNREGTMEDGVWSCDEEESSELIVSISLTVMSQSTLTGLRNTIQIPSVLPEGKLKALCH